MSKKEKPIKLSEMVMSMGFVSQPAINTISISQKEEKIEEDKLNEGSYEAREIDHASKGHDWEYKMSLQIRGDGGSTKWLSISKEQLAKIKKILG